MAHVTVHDDVSLSDPFLVEGLPGVGLVGKIAADHLVDSLGMTYHASIDECEGLPRVVMYDRDDYAVQPPVRIYVDESLDLMVLQSDVPINQAAAGHFAECVVGWLADRDVTPVFLSGMPTETKRTPPSLFGVASGDGGRYLSDVDVATPSERGIISGPTGALFGRAREHSMDAVGFVVESDRQFPDPEASRILLKDGVGPVTGADVPLEDLVEQAGDIKAAKEQLAERMRQATEAESTQARPLRMYQ